MKIIDRSVYVGPSLYAHFPVIRLDVDLGELEEGHGLWVMKERRLFPL